MKYIITAFLLCLSIMLFSQEYKIANTGGKLILNNIDEANITAYDGNEIIFSVRKERDEESERAKGLKIVNSQGLDENTGIGLSVIKENGNVIATQIGDCNCSDNEGFKIMIPRSMGIEYNHSALNSERLRINEVDKEIVVSANYTDIELTNVTGPMSIKTVYGDIEAKFKSLNQEASISIYSVYGFVDVACPPSTKAKLDLKTPYGQIYTDFDIEVETKGSMKNLSDKKIMGQINNGGVNLSLKSGYDNIYFRQK